MKKRYTKKQISEAIAYWEKQLASGNYAKIGESPGTPSENEERRFAFTENTTNEDIIGWACELYGCENGSQLYSELVPDEVETWDGKQTAADDFDEFQASYQDMIGEDDFLDGLAEEISKKYPEDAAVSEQELRKAVDDAAEIVLDDALRNFDYSGC